MSFSSYLRTTWGIVVNKNYVNSRVYDGPPDVGVLGLSRVLLGFELLSAMKHHATPRRLFITGLQDSSMIVSISVTDFEVVARSPL
ncbi:hypothetical protein EVAR_80551_1 [Eumeta japonica]|uniref:Uncharacterized protein n=1 Tax=Eumeta variegata TaxID=151549 RepID=A0A4C1TMQ8_EUMVA|nr:hypothetical protein EVAR_80551_1 [Eumeta japonica]